MNAVTDFSRHYVDHYPAEVARLAERDPTVRTSLATFPVATLATLFSHLDATLLASVFRALPPEKQLSVLSMTTVRVTLLLLKSLPATELEVLLASAPASLRSELNKILTFPDGTAGAYMDRPFGNFTPGITVDAALDRLKAANQTRARSLYIVDEDAHLLGRVDLQDMALASGDSLLGTMIHPVDGYSYLTTPREELIDMFDEHRVDSVPIIDQTSRLIGVVRYTSLFQAAEDEASADIQTMVGASADERALSPPGFAVRKRLPWLHINLLTAFLAAAVVGVFEATIAQFTALAILLPVVAGQSGNAGSQALAVTMRGLALKEISVLQWRGVLFKEIRVGIVDGLALAVTCGLGVLVWSQSFGLTLVIGIAMIISMIAAGIAGALVPIVLLRLGQDPATASSIILTTVTDVAGFISFLGTATLLSFML